MTENKPIMIDNDISNFVLVCYYDKSTNELVHIEQYGDNSGDIETDIKSYEYGYNAEIIKPEELFKQLTRKTQECEELRTDIKDIANLLDLDTGEEYNFGNIEIAIKGLKQECERWKSNFNGKVSAIEDILQQLDQLKSANEQAEQKINKIKDKCNETLELMDKDSGTNAYAGGRCTEAVQILQIIDEVE